jgi:hypothetical protein
MLVTPHVLTNRPICRKDVAQPTDAAYVRKVIDAG